MPLDLRNASSNFEHLMELLLTVRAWKTCLAYFVDVAIMGKNFEGHFSNLGDVFGMLRNANLQLNAEKYVLFQEKLNGRRLLLSLSKMFFEITSIISMSTILSEHDFFDYLLLYPF